MIVGEGEEAGPHGEDAILLSQQLWEIKNQKMRWKASEDEHVVAYFFPSTSATMKWTTVTVVAV